MSRHYFLLSSLPLLDPAQDRLPDLRDFEEACSRWLSPEELVMLAQAGPDWPGTLPSGGILARWFEGERGLRNALAAARCRKRGIDAGNHLRQDPSGDAGMEVFSLEEIARAAVQAENPLEAEETIFRGRWNRLDDLERGHFYDFDQVLVYRIRLLLLAARKSMGPQAGRQAFDLLYDKVSSTFPLNLEI